jgi:hypothetical protein
MESLLDREGLRIERFIPGSAIYPNPPRLMSFTHKAFWLLEALFVRCPDIPLASTAPKYLVTDALVLAHGAGHERMIERNAGATAERTSLDL